MTGSSTGLRQVRHAVGATLALMMGACGGSGTSSSNASSDPASLVDRQGPSDAATARRDRLIGDTLAQASAYWQRQFARFGDDFAPARAVLFAASYESPCKPITVDDGPTFCRADSHIYISDANWARFDQRMGGVVPIAQAVVVAHEVGHVVQRQTGDYGRMMSKIEAAPMALRGRLNARLELQADCYAGLWFRERPEARDPVARAAAEQSRALFGDDTEQIRVRGWHDPAEVSHGLSAERVAAFRRGLNGRGDPDDCAMPD